VKALFYPQFERLEVAERPMPRVGEDEALLRVAACGICGSELEAFRKKSPRRTPPLIMGHEFCGIVDDVGRNVSRDLIGRRFVSNSIISCGSCSLCQRGRAHLCHHRQVFGMQRNGAFAEFVNVPANCLIDWPQSLPAEQACLAEPLANGVHIYKLVEHLEPKTVLVIGAGPIGLMCQQVFQVLGGCEVMVSDLNPTRLDVARRLRAKLTIDGRTSDVVQEVMRQTENIGVDLVIDAVGAAITKRQSISTASSGGAAVWIGLHENTMTFDSYDITLPERQILGTYGASLDDLKQAVELMRQQRIDSSWTQLFPMDNSVEAFQRMLQAKEGDIKAVIVPG